MNTAYDPPRLLMRTCLAWLSNSIREKWLPDSQ